VEEPKDPDTCTLYALLNLFASKDTMKEVHDLYVNGGAAYGYLKQDLFELINDYFANARAKKKELLNNSDYLRDVFKKGAEKARAKATVTLDTARDRMGLNY
jgi:tryptophanyl-tRNA synthetase